MVKFDDNYKFDAKTCKTVLNNISVDALKSISDIEDVFVHMSDVDANVSDETMRLMDEAMKLLRQASFKLKLASRNIKTSTPDVRESQNILCLRKSRRS